MKKYMLFAGDTYYPSGGFFDLVGDYDTVEEAREKGAKYDWYQVVDSITFEIK